MSHLEPNELAVFFLALGLLLGAARLFGELAKLLKQPSVVGEIVAGILLGPTVLGSIYPPLQQFLFPRQGPVSLTLDGISTLGIVLFLMVAGMEVDISTVWRRGRAAMTVSASGILAPFAVGFAAAWHFAPYFAGGAETHRLILSLFIATAMSISALPVIVKILMDLGYYRSDLGAIIISAAVINDLFGWIVFALVLSLFHGGDGNSSIVFTVLMTIGFTVVMLTVGRRLMDAIIPRLQVAGTWPGGMVAFAISGALMCAALTEWIGIHAIFGAFMFGVALGESDLLKERTRVSMEQFVSVIFAPIFFASIGLKVNFARDFDLGLVAIVLLIASAGKILGCGFGARLSGMSWKESWVTGFALNARGAMEIILGVLGMQAGIIDERMFVALVVTALVTSMMSGYFIELLMGKTKKGALAELIANGEFARPLKAKDRFDAIHELAVAAAPKCGLTPKTIFESARDRELIAPTGFANGLAAPHARIEGLGAPLVAVGISEHGLDFDSEDGSPSKIIFLIITPADDDGAQLKILSEIARYFMNPELASLAGDASGKSELIALLKKFPPAE